MYAQEPEKNKSSPAPSRGQERSIKEIGISVKSEPSKTTKTTKTTKVTKTTSSPPSSKEEPIKTEPKSKATKKPE